MHRLRSKSSITHFKLSAFLLCLKCLLVPTAFGFLVDSIFFKNKEFPTMALVLGGLAFCVTFIQWIMSQRTRCPLCLTPVLAVKSCSKHRSARPLFGSYRLRVALAILFKGRFYCPYCHEPTAMEVRYRKEPTPLDHD
jgi:hypothetical protein